MKLQLLLLYLIPIVYCKEVSSGEEPITGKLPAKVSEIELPSGYKRMDAGNHSFSWYLRETGIKKDRTVYLFNGTKKKNQQAQYAVLNIPVPAVDLQQCADAVMRVRAEYLFSLKRYTEISFSDNAGRTYQFSAPYTKEHLEKYLLKVYAMCGTASLQKQLKPVQNFESIEPGDVLIKGGSPGHAVLVMDVAINEQGNKIYLLAQSYMPAQDIHILKNPSDQNLSPWYEAGSHTQIITPEWVFEQGQLRRW